MREPTVSGAEEQCRAAEIYGRRVLRHHHIAAIASHPIKQGRAAGAHMIKPAHRHHAADVMNESVAVDLRRIRSIAKAF